ncbi:hypothetical protein EON64_19590 [archaeon]|nr:MAG: hypothetical protein EON64_19590 [archaeon]
MCSFNLSKILFQSSHAQTPSPSLASSMAQGSRFKRVYHDTDPAVNAHPDKVKRLVLCSGKLYYELVEEREKKGITNIAIVRVEQLAPFPFDKVAAEVARYANAEVVWAQEEPKNMGAWSFVQPRIATATRVLNQKEMHAAYVGRAPSAAVATGLGAKAHNAEQSAICEKAIAHL